MDDELRPLPVSTIPMASTPSSWVHLSGFEYPGKGHALAHIAEQRVTQYRLVQPASQSLARRGCNYPELPMCAHWTCTAPHPQQLDTVNHLLSTATVAALHVSGPHRFFKYLQHVVHVVVAPAAPPQPWQQCTCVCPARTCTPSATWYSGPSLIAPTGYSSHAAAKCGGGGVQCRGRLGP